MFKLHRRSIPSAIMALFVAIPTCLWSVPGQAADLDSLVASVSCDRTPDESKDFMSARRHLAQQLDAVGSGDVDALVRIYCSVPDWRIDERIFFTHPSVRSLGQDDRLLFDSALATLDPFTIIERSKNGEVVAPEALRPAIMNQTLRLVAKVSALSVDQQLAAYLGDISALDNMSRKDQMRLSLANRIAQLAADPAIVANFRLIQDFWFSDFVKDDTEMSLWTNLAELVELKIIISRNLQFRNLSVTQEQVATEIHRIRSARSQLSTFSLFANRRTLYLGDGLNWESGKPIFGSTKSLVELENQGGQVRFVDNTQSIVDAAELAMDEIRNTPSLTILIGAHGRTPEIDLGSGIDAEKLAQSFVTRSGVQRDNAAPALLIVMSCESHNFARRLLDAMHRIDPSAPKPIIIVPGEYGQAFLKYPNERFLRGDLGLSSGQVSTLENVFAGSHAETSVYVTDDHNVSMQVL